ncbi:DUF3653 domain-containing protein [Cognatiluteimonas lumbrici]|uniref:DUF3653 domain-containing protein n=1 Tax=Cognatiluteimonas lumbrici TaxID=2559601 RepID=UPI00112E00BD|nr:DUF3653 domain-containing protein [Luteimonas lumbrici]
MQTRPPCWPESRPCPNECAHQLYERTVHNLTPLHGRWAGWRLAGRELVAPDGDRITPERLRGLLWRQEHEQRIERAAGRRAAEQLRRQRQPVKVIVVELAELRVHGQFAG